MRHDKSSLMFSEDIERETSSMKWFRKLLLLLTYLYRSNHALSSVLVSFSEHSTFDRRAVQRNVAYSITKSFVYYESYILIHNFTILHFKHDIKNNTAWKESKYGVFSGPYFSSFGLNTERYCVSLPIQSECRKTRTGKNSVFRHFSSSVKLPKLFKISWQW